MFLEKDLIDFVGGLQEKVANYIPILGMKSEHVRKGQIFRASAAYRGHVWRDWVYVNWGDEGLLPNKIYGFVNLGDIPHNSGLEYGGIALHPGIYGIVESSLVSDDEVEIGRSDLFLPIATEVGGLTDNNVSNLRLFLADVEAFEEPVAVIPDLGGPPNGYFALNPRASWPDMFTEFLEIPPEENDMVDDYDEMEE